MISFEANFDGIELWFDLLAEEQWPWHVGETNILLNDEYGGLVYFLSIMSGHRGGYDIFSTGFMSNSLGVCKLIIKSSNS